MIAITGAYGFIGVRLAIRMRDESRYGRILVVDRGASADKALNKNLITDLEYLGHEEFLKGLIDGRLHPKLIIHLGACSDTTEKDWSFLKRNNLEFSQRVWEWCAKNNSRLIYASSAATYGDGSLGFDDDLDLDRLQPLNLYARSKHEFDLWVRDQTGSAKPPQCIGFKFFNVFGPGESHKGRMASMVYHGFNQIKTKGKVRLFKSHRSDYEDGGQMRDFVFVEDVVDVILRAVDDASISGLYNLGTGRAESFKALAEATFAAMNIIPDIEYIDMPKELQGKYQYYTEASMLKSRQSGLRHEFRSLREAVYEYVNGYLRG